MPDRHFTDAQFKMWAVKELFIGAADRNYFLARFSLISGMSDEFHWQSAQCLEKYFKAGLLLNSRSVKNLGHDLEQLLVEHREVYGEYSLPVTLKSLYKSGEFVDRGRVDDVIQRVSNCGHPDSRYNQRSYMVDECELFTFDEIVFELRRRIGDLNGILGKDYILRDDEHKVPMDGKLFSDMVVEMPNYQFWSMNIPSGNFMDLGTDFSDAIYRWNLSFRRCEADTELPIPRHLTGFIGGWRNSFLTNLFLRLANGKHSAKRLTDLRRRVGWLLDNIRIERSFQEEFRGLLNTRS